MALHDSRDGVLRRLRKLSDATGQPLKAQARALCVGPAVVYRVSMKLKAAATRCDTAWIIAVSQGKFQAFHAHARAVLALPSASKRRLTGFAPVDRFRIKMIEILCCYDSLHGSFDTQALIAAWCDAQRAMEAFLEDCWAALELLLPVLSADSRFPALSREVMWLTFLLRDLLALPDKVISAHDIYANAVLSIHDAEDSGLSDRSCSICLDGFGGEARGDAMQAPVRLPCHHAFHEDCLLEWLRYNPSCPECRDCVGCRHRSRVAGH